MTTKAAKNILSYLLLAVFSFALLLPSYKVYAQQPGQNGVINALEHGWITQEDGCSTDTNQLGQTFFSKNLTNPAKVTLSNDGYDLEVGKLAWSPGGTKYVFGVPRPDELGIANADGSKVNADYSYTMMPYSNIYSFNADTVAWSPDSKTLAYANGGGLFTMRPDGTNVQLVAWGDFTDLSWSHDGDYIAFTRPSLTSFPNPGDGVDLRDQVGIIRLDGTGLKLFSKASDTSFDHAPDWSPDSQKLVFASDRSLEGTTQGNEPTQLFTMNADGTHVKQLTNNYSYRYDQPVWSPDGTKILAIKTHFNDHAGDQLVIMNAQTGAEENIYTPPCNVGFSSVGWQPVSPAADAQPATTPVYRLANWITHERLFTTNYDEIAYAEQHYDGWVYEGVAMNAYSSPQAGSTPVYRLANWITHERLFTTNYDEIAYAEQHYDGWVYEGIAFYASTNTSDLPVYRLANWITHERLFTTNPAEFAYAEQHYAGWVYEGVAFYVPEQ